RSDAQQHQNRQHAGRAHQRAHPFTAIGERQLRRRRERRVDRGGRNALLAVRVGHIVLLNTCSAGFQRGVLRADHAASPSAGREPVASSMMASWLIGLPVYPPSSPAISPSRMTSTRSATPMISGSSLEMTMTPTPDFASSLMIR